LHVMRTDNAADIRLGAALENCIFYISPMYEFLHSLDPKRTWAWRLEPRRMTRGQANLLERELPQTGDRVLMRAS
jgi:hypothetical protein